MKNRIINFLYKIVVKYRNEDVKIFECPNPVTRNRNKRKSFVIPLNKPQCPIFEDNRCCGNCKLVTCCKHFVECNCFGFVRAAREEDPKINKASKYSIGIKKGVMDWKKYEYVSEKNKKKISKCKFCGGTGKVPEKKFSLGSSSGKETLSDSTCGICGGDRTVTGV